MEAMEAEERVISLLDSVCSDMDRDSYEEVLRTIAYEIDIRLECIEEERESEES